MLNGRTLETVTGHERILQLARKRTVGRTNDGQKPLVTE
jgi:hypothetical protein